MEIGRSVRLCVCLPACLPDCLPACLSLSLCVCLSVCLSACLPVFCEASSEVGPEFELRVELYSSCVEEDFAPGAAGPRRLSRLGLSGSLGRSSGRKLRAALETAAGCGANGGGPGGEGGAGGGTTPQVPALNPQ